MPLNIYNKIITKNVIIPYIITFYSNIGMVATKISWFSNK